MTEQELPKTTFAHVDTIRMVNRDEHTSNKVAYVILDEEVDRKVLYEWLMSLKEWGEENDIDGFILVNTE